MTTQINMVLQHLRVRGLVEHTRQQSDGQLLERFVDRHDEGAFAELVRRHFPLTPSGIMRHLDLRRPIYRKTASGGHFGRSEPEFTWERTDRADVLREAANACLTQSSMV